MSELVEDRTRLPAKSWRDDWPVAVTAAAAAAVVWVVATQVTSVDLAVRAGSGTQHINVVSVIVTALVVGMAGAGLLRWLERRTPRGTATWTALALASWAVSLAGPLGARSLAAGLWLASMHLLVGAIVVVGLRRRSGHRVA